MSIEVKGLSYTYSEKTPFARRALADVTFTVNEGEFVGIIGSTGSGKSTLIQHLNALIRRTSGEIIVCGIDLTAKRPDLAKLRSKVGMLFQYPEYQLFEDTVAKDVAFGPKNFGFSEEEIKEAVRESIGLVGLDYEEVAAKSPFELSGGEKRRVAIAGVIASRPEVLVLDEPTAGLDPVGKKEILDLVVRLRREYCKTVVMISHNMDEIAEYADRVLVLQDGHLIADTTPRQLFSSEDALDGTGLEIPHTVRIYRLLKAGGIDLKEVPLTKSELLAAIKREVCR